jgi:RNA recognition motif-containing protein
MGYRGCRRAALVQMQSNNVKERIVFIQHMSLNMEKDAISDIFERFGKLTKCERLGPGKDLWMVQFARPEVPLLPCSVLFCAPTALKSTQAHVISLTVPFAYRMLVRRRRSTRHVSMAVKLAWHLQRTWVA